MRAPGSILPPLSYDCHCALPKSRLINAPAQLFMMALCGRKMMRAWLLTVPLLLGCRGEDGSMYSRDKEAFRRLDSRVPWLVGEQEVKANGICQGLRRLMKAYRSEERMAMRTISRLLSIPLRPHLNIN